MLSKREALIGYGVYSVGKLLVKRKVRQKTAPVRTKRFLGGLAAALAAAGATIGGIMFWRKRRSGGSESTAD